MQLVPGFHALGIENKLVSFAALIGCNRNQECCRSVIFDSLPEQVSVSNGTETVNRIPDLTTSEGAK